MRTISSPLYFLLIISLFSSYSSCYDSHTTLDNEQRFEPTDVSTRVGKKDSSAPSDISDASYKYNAVDDDNVSLVCPEENVNGLSIEVQYPNESSCYYIDVTASDGDYSEELLKENERSCLFTGAVNRKGSYTIVVSGRYIDTLETGPIDVPITEDGCSIKPQSYTVHVEIVCHELSAYRYNELDDCLEPLQPLDGVCARTSIPEGDMGTGMTQCIISPEGIAYLVFLTYTESLEFEDWFTPILPLDGVWYDLCQKVFDAQFRVSEKQYEEGIEYYNDWFYHLASCDQNTEL